MKNRTWKKNRTLFISDIHGRLDALKALLNQVDYDPLSDRLVLLGDYVGQSSDNMNCLLYIFELTKQSNAVALMGNHDLNLWKYLKANGGSSPPKSARYPYTSSLAEEIERLHPELIDFLGSLRFWYADDHFVAVHAGFDPYQQDWRSSSADDFTTIRDPFLSAPLSLPETVVFGHTPCTALHNSPEVWYGPGKIGIDGGAGKGLQLNCLIFDGVSFSSTSTEVV